MTLRKARGGTSEVLLICMSNKGRNEGRQAWYHLEMGRNIAGEYTEAVAKAAEENQDFVMGFISIKPSAWKGGPGSPGFSLFTLSQVA